MKCTVMNISHIKNYTIKISTTVPGYELNDPSSFWKNKLFYFIPHMCWNVSNMCYHKKNDKVVIVWMWMYPLTKYPFTYTSAVNSIKKKLNSNSSIYIYSGCKQSQKTAYIPTKQRAQGRCQLYDAKFA